jgi:hypothetical protein
MLHGNEVIDSCANGSTFAALAGKAQGFPGGYHLKRVVVGRER